MNMKMGKILLKERKRLKLTQREFVQDIVSVSQYSRVENGEQDLRASDFIKLVSANDLDIIQFIKNDKKTNQEILEELAQTFYDRDLDRARKINQDLKAETCDSALIIRAELIVSILENKDISQDIDFKKKLSEEINKSDDWTEDKVFLQLFGSSMLIFDMDRLNLYMNKIIKEYFTKITNLSFEKQRRIAGICINYLNRSYLEKDLTLVKPTINLLGNLAQNPDLLMYRLLGRYFDYLFNNESIKKDRILNLLKDAGYEKFSVNLAQ